MRSSVISLFASSVAGRAALCFPAGITGKLFALVAHMRITSIREKRAEGWPSQLISITTLAGRPYFWNTHRSNIVKITFLEWLCGFAAPQGLVPTVLAILSSGTCHIESSNCRHLRSQRGRKRQQNPVLAVPVILWVCWSSGVFLWRPSFQNQFSFQCYDWWKELEIMKLISQTVTWGVHIKNG